MELNLMYKAILDNMNEEVYVRDLDKNLLFINPASEKLTGWSFEEALGKKCYEVFGDEDLRCREVLKGEYFMDSSVSHKVVKKLMQFPEKEAKITDANYETLTPREQKIMVLLAEGLSAKQIAEKLFISPKTVENHRSNILRKLNLHSTMELIRYAARLGIIDVDLWKI